MFFHIYVIVLPYQSITNQSYDHVLEITKLEHCQFSSAVDFSIMLTFINILCCWTTNIL